MTAQLARLVELSARPAMTLRVLPLDARIGEFYLPHSSFSLFRFADPEDPDIVVLETVTNDLHLGDEEDISGYGMLFDWLAAPPALCSPSAPPNGQRCSPGSGTASSVSVNWHRGSMIAESEA